MNLSAMTSPLLDFPISRAKGVVYNIAGGNDMSLNEIQQASKVIYSAIDKDAFIKFGTTIDPKIKDGEVCVLVSL